MKSFESLNSSQEPSEQAPTASQEKVLNDTTIETPADLEEYASTLDTALEEEIEKLEESSTESWTNRLEILNRFREKVAEELKIAVLTATLFAPTQAHGATLETMQESMHSPESYEYKVEERIAELKDKVLHDNKETYHILFGRRDNLQEISKFEGNKNSAVVSQTGDELLDAGVKSINIMSEENTPFRKIVGYFTNSPMTKVDIHNHPYAVAQEVSLVSEDDVERMKSSEVPPAIFPPSSGDLGSSMMFSRVEFDSIGYVVEPSGTWKYDVNESDPNIIKMRDLKSRAEYEFSIILQKYISSNPELSGEMEKVLEVLQTDQYFEYFEKHHPELAKSISVLNEKIQQQLIDQLDEDFILADTEIETLASSIRKASIAGENATELIHDYVNTATHMGFHIEYQGNDGTYITPTYEKPETVVSTTEINEHK